MSQEEFREYTLRGELLPENWEQLLGMLGRTGLAAELQDPPHPSTPIMTPQPPEKEKINNAPLPPAEQDDLKRYAVSIGKHPRNGSQAWNNLERSFAYARYPNHYGGYAWYDSYDYSGVPADLFGHTEHKENGVIDHQSTQLNIDALEKFLANVHERISDDPENAKLLKHVMGNGANFSILSFLGDFVEHTRSQNEDQ